MNKFSKRSIQHKKQIDINIVIQLLLKIPRSELTPVFQARNVSLAIKAMSMSLKAFVTHYVKNTPLTIY